MAAGALESMAPQRVVRRLQLTERDRSASNESAEKSVSTAMRKVLLSVGTNHTLLGVRNTVFARRGYAVISAKSAAAAIEAIQSRRIDAVIVGHSLSRSLQDKITATAKDKRLPVIVLHAVPNDRPILSADANLCGIDGAALIMEMLRSLIAEEM